MIMRNRHCKIPEHLAFPRRAVSASPDADVFPVVAVF